MVCFEVGVVESGEWVEGTSDPSGAWTQHGPVPRSPSVTGRAPPASPEGAHVWDHI